MEGIKNNEEHSRDLKDQSSHGDILCGGRDRGLKSQTLS